jgi:hypothetical protein
MKTKAVKTLTVTGLIVASLALDARGYSVR